MTETLSDWRKAFVFRPERPFNPESFRPYSILFSSLDGEPVFRLTDLKGKGDEMAVDQSFMAVDPPGAFNFLKTLGVNSTHPSPIDWLRFEGDICQEGESYRLASLQVWINGVPFETTVDHPYQEEGLGRFVMAVRNTASALEHAPLRHNPLVILPRPFRDERLILEDRLWLRLKAGAFHREETEREDISIVSLPGLRLPLKGPSDEDVVFLDTVHGGWETQPLAAVGFSWRVCGALARVPALYYAYYHTTTLLGRVRSQTRERPALVVSSFMEKWKGLKDDGLWIVESWEDLDRLSLFPPASLEVLVVDASFYKSKAYDAFVIKTISTLLDSPSLFSSRLGLSSLRTLLKDHRVESPLVTENNCSSVHLSNARRVAYALKANGPSFGSGTIQGFPLELGRWSVTLWEDVSEIPVHYYPRLTGMDSTFHLGFSPFEPSLGSGEIDFMRHLCIEPYHRTFSHSALPNTADLIHGCFLPMDLSWSPRQVSNLSVTKVEVNPYERYLVGRSGKEVEDLDERDIRYLVLPATQAVQCNPTGHFVLCAPEELGSLVEDYYAKEIVATQARLDLKHKNYTASLASLEHLESLPTRSQGPQGSQRPSTSGHSAAPRSAAPSRSRLSLVQEEDPAPAPLPTLNQTDNPLDSLRSMGHRLLDRSTSQATGTQVTTSQATGTQATAITTNSMAPPTTVLSSTALSSTALAFPQPLGQAMSMTTLAAPGSNPITNLTSPGSNPITSLTSPGSTAISTLLLQAIQQQLQSFGNGRIGSDGSTVITGSIALPPTSLLIDQETGEVVQAQMELALNPPPNEDLEETNEDLEETNEDLEETNEDLEETNEDLEETNEYSTNRSVELEEAPDLGLGPSEPPLSEGNNLSIQTAGGLIQTGERSAPPPPPPSQQSVRPRRGRRDYQGLGRRSRGTPMAPPSEASGLLTTQLEMRLKTLLEEMSTLSKYIKDMTLQKARSVSLVRGEDAVKALLEDTCSVCRVDEAQVVVPCLHPLCLGCAWRLFTSKGPGSRDRQVRFAECPCCKTTMTLSQVWCPLLSKPKSEPSLETMVDSRTFAILTNAKEWAASLTKPVQGMIVVSNEEEAQALLLGSYFAGLTKGLPFETKTWTYGESLPSSSSLSNTITRLWIVLKGDLEGFPVHCPIEMIYTSFEVGEDLRDLPLYRHYLPSEFKLPPVRCFSYLSK